MVQFLTQSLIDDAQANENDNDDEEWYNMTTPSFLVAEFWLQLIPLIKLLFIYLFIYFLFFRNLGHLILRHLQDARGKI